MRWPDWLRWPKPRNGHAAQQEREQEAKLAEFRAQVPEVRRQVNQFTVAVEAAMRRRYR